MSRGKRLGVAALAGAVGLLLLVNFHLVQSPIDVSPVAPPEQQADAPRPGGAGPATPLDKKTAEQFREIVGRPLFNPSRRPVQRRQAVAGKPKAASVEFRLIGVMKFGKQPPRALLRSANEPMGKWVAEGGEFNGWRLHKVKERSVIVQAGGRTQELTLSIPRAAPDEPAGPKR